MVRSDGEVDWKESASRVRCTCDREESTTLVGSIGVGTLSVDAEGNDGAA